MKPLRASVALVVLLGSVFAAGAETAVRLDGAWDFYANVDASPDELVGREPQQLNVPGIWDSVQPALGNGTYQFQLTGLKPGTMYALQFKGINSQARLWIDGSPLGTWGAEEVNFLPTLYTFTARNSSADLTVAVRNPWLASGGLWLPVVFGTVADVERKAAADRFFEVFLIGGVLMMGLYHLALFLFRTRDRAPLYFGLFCLLSVLKASLSGEQILTLQWPGFDQAFGLRLAYLATILLPLAFVAYLQAVFPVQWYKPLLGVLLVGAVAQTGMSVLLPLHAVQSLFLPYQLVILAGVVQCAVVMGLAVKRHLPGAGIMLAGFVLLAGAATNDILHDTKVINTFYSLNLGLFVFLFSQSLIIGGLFSRSLHQVEELNETLELKVAERTSELEVLSRSDSLTGLINRRHFWMLLSQEWERWTRYGQDFSLAMIDVDHFKAINDQFGHAAGDEALVRIATLLQANVRKSDAVSRYGGEEFCLLLPGVSAPEAHQVLEKIRTQLEGLTFSYGIAQASHHAGAQQVIDAADALMYRAKESGRNRGLVEDTPPR